MKQSQKKTMHEHVRKVAAGSLSLFTAPAKAISLPLSRHYTRRMLRRKGKAQWLFWLEVCLFLFAVGLCLTSISLSLQTHFQTETQPITVTMENQVQKNGEPYAFTVTVKNTFGKTVTNGTISLHLPSHTTVLTAPENFSYQTLVLPLDRLVPGAVRTMVFSAATLEDREDTVSHPLFVQFEGTEGSQRVSAVGEMVLPRLDGDPVKIEAYATVSPEQQKTAMVDLTFTNTSTAFFSPFLFDVCPMSASDTACVSGKMQFFSPSGVATSTVSLVLPVTEKQVSVFLKTVSAEKTVVFEKVDVNLSVSVETPVTVVITAPILNAQATVRYYSRTGEQLGRGVFPPVVGQSTVVWFFWHVDPIDRGVKTLALSWIVPADAVWSGKLSGQSAASGKMTFDAKTRLLTWRAENLSQEQMMQGVDVSGVLTVTPKEKQTDVFGSNFENLLVSMETADGFFVTDVTSTLFLDQKK